MRNRLIVVLAVLAIVASACGSTTETVDAAAPAGVEDAVVEDAVVEDAVIEEETVAAEAATTKTTTAESTLLLPSGRDRILANHTEGKPYVLWYWGAH